MPRLFGFTGTLALTALLVGAAHAQTYPQVRGPAGSNIAPQVVSGTAVDPATGAPCVIGSTPTCLGDTNDSAFGGAVALTVGVADTQARRSLAFQCASSGGVTVTYADGSTMTWQVVGSAATQTLPIAVTEVDAAPASCTNFWNLK